MSVVEPIKRCEMAGCIAPAVRLYVSSGSSIQEMKQNARSVCQAHCDELMAAGRSDA